MSPSREEGVPAPVSLQAWLTAREPALPEELLRFLLREAPGGDAGARELRRRGEAALARALARPGRNREAAFDLLVGDAFLTYACEALARSGAEPGAELDGFLQELGASFP